MNGDSQTLEGIWYLSFSFQKFQQKAIKIKSAKVGDINYFGKEATDKFDAIVFGVPIRMKDEVLTYFSIYFFAKLIY